MLPFLKPKNAASTIIVNTKEEHEEGEQPHALLSISEQLISAIHAKDAKAVAEALVQLKEPDEQE